MNVNLFYDKTYQSRLLLENYMEIPDLAFLLKACRLKPYDLFMTHPKNYRTKLYNLWFDEYNNSINFSRKDSLNSIDIVLGDLSTHQFNMTTDVYFGLSINKIAKISKFIYIISGNDEDFSQDCFYVLFLGLDNYFRTYLFMYNEFYQVSPLMIGFNRLKEALKNSNIFYYKESQIKKNTRLPCKAAKVWLGSLPACTDFLKVLENQCNVLYHILKEK